MERCRYPWVRSVHTSYTEQRGRELRRGPDDDPLNIFDLLSNLFPSGYSTTAPITPLPSEQ